MKLNLPTSLGALLLVGLLLLLSPARGEEAKPKDLDTLVANQRLRQIAAALALSDEQKEKVRPILFEEVKSIRAVREAENVPMQEKFAKEQAIKDSSKAKLKPILTAEQFTKWEEIHKRRPKKEEPK
jgi:hypothetical protein